jgi:cyclic-di-AMP phosphodiesterase PgpH
MVLMMNGNAETKDNQHKTANDHRWVDWLRLSLLGLVMAAISAGVMLLPLWPTERVVLEVGDVAQQDIHAPEPIRFESEVSRAREQDRAASAVRPVYTLPDPELARQQLGRARDVLDYLGSIRADFLASAAQKRGWMLAVDELSDLSAEELTQILALSDESWDRVRFETQAVIDQAMRQEIREGYLSEALEDVPARVSLDLTDEETAVTIMLARQFLAPNAFLDVEATEAAKARIREEVGQVLRDFEAGEIIVRQGARVLALDIEALDQFGLRQPQIRWFDVASVSLLAVSMTLTLGLFLAQFQPEVLWDGQQSFILTLMIVLSVLAAGLMTPGGDLLRYIGPASTLPMLAAAALGSPVGVVTALFLGGTVGVTARNSLEMATYVTVSGLIAVLTLERVKSIGALFRSGMFVALTNVVVILAFNLSQMDSEPLDLLVTASAGVMNGGISASLALGGLFLMGPLFDITTTMRLMELSRPDRPLLRRLLREAPASYHHSLMVANLAEQAAERIEADALLTRVGAYYHDVGKLVRPYFFTENQAQGVNPHDRLDPEMSAQILIGHVEDGIELAKRYHLPRRVRAFIPEHHGTNWVSFLYHRALELASDPETVDPDNFRHRGPKPQSRETALVMLADSCEAAVRSSRPTDRDEVAEIVNRIIDSRVQDGQLNESGLTLHDLDVIRETFISSLKGVFHPRIKYPPKKEEKKENGKENGKEKE